MLPKANYETKMIKNPCKSTDNLKQKCGKLKENLYKIEKGRLAKLKGPLS
jgi:hypothetical protein